jgi:hypothetical protein
MPKASISELEDGSGYWVVVPKVAAFYGTLAAALEAVQEYFATGKLP